MTRAVLPRESAWHLYLAGSGGAQPSDRLADFARQTGCPDTLAPLLVFTSPAPASVTQATPDLHFGFTETVTFDQPLVHYVENFLDLPVGEVAPLGYYNPETDSWEPAPDGLVIGILAPNGHGPVNRTPVGEPPREPPVPRHRLPPTRGTDLAPGALRRWDGPRRSS